MADENEDESPEVTPGLKWDIDNQVPPMIYANQGNILVGNSDVILFFGIEPLNQENPVYTNARIALTHDAFMVLMEYWLPRYALLRNLYKDKRPSLRGMDPEVLNTEFRKLIEKSTGEEIDETGENNA